MNLKRLWDTENKKIVWAIPTNDPHKKLQVWTNDDGSKFYVYDSSKWMELSPAGVTVSEYGPTVWKELEDETVGYYLTNEPTDLFNRDEGEDVAYAFKNGTTTLQSGKVKEGETPEYTGDTPTKSATAQYTYTFSGWNPTVGPIYKKTDFKAQFDSTVNEYTITWKDGDDVTLDTDTVAYGGTPEYTGETPTKTATAQYTYTWDEGWTPTITTVTGDATYTATFTSTVNEYTISIAPNDGDLGTVSESSVADVPYGTKISIDEETGALVIGEGETATTVTGTPTEGYGLVGWTDDLGEALPATLSGDLSIVAVFEQLI